MPFEQQVDNVAKTAVDGQDSQQDAITTEVAQMYTKEGMETEQFRHSTSDSANSSLPKLQLDDFKQGSDLTEPQGGRNGSESGEIKDSGKKPSEFLDNGESGDIDGSLGGSGSEEGVWNCPEDVFDCGNPEDPILNGPTSQSSEMEKVDQDKEQGDVVKDDSQAQSESNDLKDEQELQNLEKETQKLNNDHLKSQTANKEMDDTNNSKNGDVEHRSRTTSKENSQMPIGSDDGHGPLINKPSDGNGNGDPACIDGEGGGGFENPNSDSSQSQELTGTQSEKSDSVEHESQDSGANAQGIEKQKTQQSNLLKDLIHSYESKDIEQKRN